MPTASGCAGRRRRLWDKLGTSCEIVIVSDPLHVAYLAGYAPPPFTFRTVGGGACLVMWPDRAVLVGDNLLQPFLDAAHVDEVEAPHWYGGRYSPIRLRRDVLMRAVADLLPKDRIIPIGLEVASFPLAIASRLDTLRFKEIAPILLELRRTKDPDEVDAIRQALRAAEAGIAAATRDVRPGMTEMDAFRLIEAAALDVVGERALIYGDFVSGPGLERRLGPPSSRVLKPGDLFLMDFSVVVSGYRGDIAQTIVVGGGPSAFHDQGRQACLAALAAGEAQLKPGTTCTAIDAEVRRALAEAGGDGDVRGHLGHGIGLDHPEPPFIVRESYETLVEGDVITLEPGQYGHATGGLRFERNYLITRDGFELLSQTSF